MSKLKIEYVRTEDLIPYANNAKIHTGEQVEQIKKSIKDYGMDDPIAVWKNNEIIEGHGRLMACKELGIEEVPIIRLDSLTDEQRKAYALVHNKLTMNSDFDLDMLDLELDSLPDFDAAFYDFESARQDLEEGEAEARGRLADVFLVPPFDVLNARSGEWLERKKYWNNMIKDKAQARADSSFFMSNTEEEFGISFTSNVSIIDPVLCELALRWFCPQGGTTFDCFAGDTGFGYVSAALDHPFTGIELRQEQVQFNKEATEGMQAEYICDDGCNVLQHIPENSQDMLFSCPPYFNLEIYSDLENDASNQETYEEFYAIINTAFERAIKCLRDNRFAVIVAGDVRDKKTGAYYNFPNDIIDTFRDHGLVLYNNIKLLTPIGTAAARAARYMKFRKVAHVYQDVLVFYKGDPRKIKEIYPEVEVAHVSEDMEL